MFPCRYVFISQKAYQETEDRPESSVYTEMRGVAVLGDSVRDTTEYAKPSEVREDRRQTAVDSLTIQIQLILCNNMLGSRRNGMTRLINKISEWILSSSFGDKYESTSG